MPRARDASSRSSRMVKTQLVQRLRHRCGADRRSSGTASTPRCLRRRTARRTATKRAERLELGPAPTFLFVAHNYYLKGLPAVLRALARLIREGSRRGSVCVGSGPVEAFAALAARLGVAAQVRFCGTSPIPGRTWPRPTSCSTHLLRFVQPGGPRGMGDGGARHHEPVGWRARAVARGARRMAAGDPGDVGALARAMRSALDPARREAGAAVARSVALANSLERNFSRIEAVYMETLQARGERGS